MERGILGGTLLVETDAVSQSLLRHRRGQEPVQRRQVRRATLYASAQLSQAADGRRYATAFPLVCAGYLRRHSPSPFHDRLFILAALVQSSYCLIWDV